MCQSCKKARSKSSNSIITVLRLLKITLLDVVLFFETLKVNFTMQQEADPKLSLWSQSVKTKTMKHVSFLWVSQALQALAVIPAYLWPYAVVLVSCRKLSSFFNLTFFSLTFFCTPQSFLNRSSKWITECLPSINCSRNTQIDFSSYLFLLLQFSRSALPSEHTVWKSAKKVSFSQVANL